MSKLLLLSVFIYYSYCGFSQTHLVVEGSVGIGTESVGKALEVYGNVLSKSSPTSGTAGSFAADPGGFVSFWINDNYNPNNHTSGWKRTMNLREGLVGIGTVDPVYSLQVYGDTIGIYGEASGNNGRGVVGIATGSSGVNKNSIGVFGICNVVHGSGVTGTSNGTENGTYGNTSSRRWKSNIINISDPLNKLSNLRGVYFDWDKEHGGKHSVGFIAEEVGKVLPEIVLYEENGVDAKGMDYTKVTPLLVEAANAMRREYLKKIKGQKERIDKLEQEIALLKQIVLERSGSRSKD